MYWFIKNTISYYADFKNEKWYGYNIYFIILNAERPTRNPQIYNRCALRIWTQPFPDLLHIIIEIALHALSFNYIMNLNMPSYILWISFWILKQIIVWRHLFVVPLSWYVPIGNDEMYLVKWFHWSCKIYWSIIYIYNSLILFDGGDVIARALSLACLQFHTLYT